MAVVKQVIDNIGVIVCAVSGVILNADIIVEAGVKDESLYPGCLSEGVLASLENVAVRDSGLRMDGHAKYAGKDRKTHVEIEDANRGKRTIFQAWPSCHGK